MASPTVPEAIFASQTRPFGSPRVFASPMNSAKSISVAAAPTSKNRTNWSCVRRPPDTAVRCDRRTAWLEASLGSAGVLRVQTSASLIFTSCAPPRLCKASPPITRPRYGEKT